MQWVSIIFTGWHSALLIVAIGALVWWRIGSLEAVLVPVGGLLTLFNEVFKIAINRPRPPADMVRVLVQEHDQGFPSGHAFLAVIILGLLAYFLFIKLKKEAFRMVALAGLVMVILLVGASRVYLGVHWTSDVIGGYLIGGVFLTALIWFYRSWKCRHKADAS
jgi:membrane-associated phospholipid phosphatase